MGGLLPKHVLLVSHAKKKHNRDTSDPNTSPRRGNSLPPSSKPHNTKEEGPLTRKTSLHTERQHLTTERGFTLESGTSMMNTFGTHKDNPSAAHLSVTHTRMDEG